MKSKTKIIASLGPSLASLEAMNKALELGVRIFRYNSSHGQIDQLKNFVNQLNIIQKKDPFVQMFIDLPGPKIRTGELGEGLTIEEGKSYTLGENNCDIPVQAFEVLQGLEVGQKIFFDDGQITMLCREKTHDSFVVEAQNNGILLSKKGINLPSSSLSREKRWTKEDAFWLEQGLALGIKHYALSFVEDEKDIEAIKKMHPELFIIAKIERPQAIQHFEKILLASDAIMIARGDLALEIPDYEVPAFQKEAIQRCRHHEKPVIIATQMLGSMTQNLRPTRAEVSDVAHACFDLADAVMLSNETAVGLHPFETIQKMHQILLASEAFLFRYRSDYSLDSLSPEKDYQEELAIKKTMHPNEAILFSKDSVEAKLIKHRPAAPLLCKGEPCGAYAFHWGVELAPRSLE